MFSWVVKVVPQPPEGPGTLGNEPIKAPVVEPPKPKPLPKPNQAPKPKEPPKPKEKVKDVKVPAVKTTEEEGSEDSQQSGVLGWLSNGFVSALPQPTGSSPRLGRANSDARSGEDGERSGMMGWVTQGLTRVLPQPDEKYRASSNEEHNAENRTEIYEVEQMPDYDPLPHIPVVEMVSEDEEDVETLHFPQMVRWLKQTIPQPPGAEPAIVSNRSSPVNTMSSPPPESLSGISLDADGKAAGVVGWFVSGLGLRMPQPVTASKDEPTGAADVKKGGKALRAP